MMALKGAYLSNGFLDEASCAPHCSLSCATWLLRRNRPRLIGPRLIVAQDKMVVYMSSDQWRSRRRKINSLDGWTRNKRQTTRHKRSKEYFVMYR